MDPEPEPDPDPDPAYLARSGPEPDPVKILDPVDLYSVPVTSGVPQGSCLGPVLFLIYVNHVVSGLTCRYKVFADDIKLYLAHDDITLPNSPSQLQQDVDILVSVKTEVD